MAIIDDLALSVTELGHRLYELADLTAEVCEVVGELRRRPPVVVVIVSQNHFSDVYEGEAEEVVTYLSTLTDRQIGRLRRSDGYSIVI